jgi:thymidine kinase
MGKLYFYYSAMNAGKTTTLLQSSFNYQERGMKTLLFTPKIDDRYEVGVITSRIGLRENAVVFDEAFDFHHYLVDTIQQYHCILVDEAQFLSKDQVKQLSDLVDFSHVPVLAYGLRSDFQGEPFEGSKYLLAWADELIEIKTICHCGRKANFNARIGQDGRMQEEGEQIVIGGNQRYVSVCRRHFKTKQLSSERSSLRKCDSGILTDVEV